MEQATTTTPEETTARERLATSLRQMVDEADHLLKTAQRTGNDQFNAARDRFETRLKQAKSELGELESSAMYNARRAARAADTTVHEHPYAAMGIAAGAALLIGMLISRR